MYYVSVNNRAEIMGESSQQAEPNNENINGYRLLNMRLLCGLFVQLLCPICKTASIHLQIRSAGGSGAAGLHSMFHVHCSNCDKNIASAQVKQ